MDPARDLSMNLEAPGFSESMSRPGKALRVTSLPAIWYVIKQRPKEGSQATKTLVRNGQPCRPELQGLPEYLHFGFLGCTSGSFLETIGSVTVTTLARSLSWGTTSKSPT